MMINAPSSYRLAVSVLVAALWLSTSPARADCLDDSPAARNSTAVLTYTTDDGAYDVTVKIKKNNCAGDLTTSEIQGIPLDILPQSMLQDDNEKISKPYEDDLSSAAPVLPTQKKTEKADTALNSTNDDDETPEEYEQRLSSLTGEVRENSFAQVEKTKEPIAINVTNSDENKESMADTMNQIFPYAPVEPDSDQ